MVFYNRENIPVSVTWILVILLVPLIPPDYFQTLSIINSLFELLVAIIFISLLFFTLVKREFNIFVIVSFIFIIWRSFSSCYYNDGVLDLVNSARILSIILFINLTVKRFPKSTLKALSLVTGAYIIINYLTLYFWPSGLYLDNPRLGQYREAWFLGIDNQFAFVLIPSITLIILYSWFNKNRLTITVWIFLTVVLLTLIKASSATAIVSVAFVIISILLNVKKSIKPIYRFSLLSISYVILWILLVRFNSMDSFRMIIIDLLEKDLTLSGRTDIWAVVFNTIPESLWNGFGINTTVLAGIKTYFAAHNMILQILLDSGIIGLSIFLVCILIAGVRLTEFKNNPLSVILLIGVFGVLIGGLTESYRINYFFLLLTLSYNIKHIVERNKQQRIT